eukprot:Sspe_Gene.103043::Locus_78878_Transcript_1_1_Confidence_1.000_Length_315::g.103043::m.103043
MSIPLLSQKTQVIMRETPSDDCFDLRYFCGSSSCGWMMNLQERSNEVLEYVWYHVEFMMDWSAKTVDLRIDGESIGKSSLKCEGIQYALFFGAGDQTSPSYFDEI